MRISAGIIPDVSPTLSIGDFLDERAEKQTTSATPISTLWTLNTAVRKPGDN